MITSFGRMPTSVWTLVESVVRGGSGAGLMGDSLLGVGGAGAGGNVADLVMLLNARFAARGEDERKFAGFVAGMLK